MRVAVLDNQTCAAAACDEGVSPLAERGRAILALILGAMLSAKYRSNRLWSAYLS